MGSQHEIRVGDRDPEMAAVKALGAALEPLDLDARKRVLAWAKDKYVEGEFREIRSAAMEGISASIEAIQTSAKNLGVTDRQFIHAVSAVRDRAKLAPVDEAPTEVIEEIAREEERISRV